MVDTFLIFLLEQEIYRQDKFLKNTSTNQGDFFCW